MHGRGRIREPTPPPHVGMGFHCMRSTPRSRASPRRNTDRCARVRPAPCGAGDAHGGTPQRPGGQARCRSPLSARASASLGTTPLHSSLILTAAWAGSTEPSEPSVRPLGALLAGRGGSSERRGSSRRLGGGRRAGAKPVDDWQTKPPFHPHAKPTGRRGFRSVGSFRFVEQALPASETQAVRVVPPAGDAPPFGSSLSIHIHPTVFGFGAPGKSAARRRGTAARPAGARNPESQPTDAPRIPLIPRAFDQACVDERACMHMRAFCARMETLYGL